MVDHLLSAAGITIFILLIIYIVAGAFIEAKHPPFGHETGLVILLGFLISLIAFLSGGDHFSHLFMFNDTVFFYVCLPPIIFAAGYNMRRRRFFANLGYILLFGLLGTLVTFIIFTTLTWAFMESGIMYKYVGGTG